MARSLPFSFGQPVVKLNITRLEDHMNTLKLMAASLLLVSGVVLAAMPTFQQLDTNKDHTLSKQEVDKVLVGIDFAAADKNKDGSLDQDEYNMVIKQLKTKDKNHKS